MDKIKTIENIDRVVEDIMDIQSVIDVIGHESDHVYQARFNQFIIELDKVAVDLIDISDEIGD